MFSLDFSSPSTDKLRPRHKKFIEISVWLNDCLMASGCLCRGRSSALPPQVEGWALGPQNTLVSDLGELGAAAAEAFTHQGCTDFCLTGSGLSCSCDPAVKSWCDSGFHM